MTTTTPCPCGLPHPYPACCGRLHAGQPAVDAAELMRSRYSAYVLKLEGYLLATWHPRTRPAALSLDDAPGAATRWLGLDVREHRRIDARHEEVEFIARYRIGGGGAVRMVERSRFEFDGRWLYVDGDVAG